MTLTCANHIPPLLPLSPLTISPSNNETRSLPVRITETQDVIRVAPGHTHLQAVCLAGWDCSCGSVPFALSQSSDELDAWLDGQMEGLCLVK